MKSRNRERQVPITATGEVPIGATIWAIAQKLGPRAERKDVLAACRKVGIRESTASAHYQLFQFARRQRHLARTLPPRVQKRIDRVVAAVADM